MKKCQMHNKKRDKLSYTVMLHYSAVTGGFVCHFLVHLRDFRQWAVQWATQIFFATDMLAPATQIAYSIWSPAQHAGSSKLGTLSFIATGTCSAAHCLHWWHSPLDRNPAGSPCLYRGLGRQLSSPPHAWCCWTCHSWADPLNTLWKSPNLPGQELLCWGLRAQNPSMTPPPPTSVQFWGRRTFQ